MSAAPQGPAPLIAQALQALGKRNLLLSIHDSSYPSAAGQETGRGTPYSQGGQDFIRFAARLGFSGLLFGPQGQTSDVNPSPYDGTIFSKNVLSIALPPLAEPAWDEILDRRVLAELVDGMPAGCGRRVAYDQVFHAQRKALWSAFQGLRRRPQSSLHGRLEAFCRENRSWLERDVGFEPLLGAESPARSGLSEAEDAEQSRAFYRFCQFVVHAQHRELRQLTRALQLKLYGDLQIGLSHQDRSVLGSLFLENYLMGAPPSRTNPEGQPWSYPVFDPEQYGALTESGFAPGPVLMLMRARIAKLLAEFDGLRIDHPHGLICPWVYKAAEPDPLLAVQQGARLFSSPDLPDHPELARYALVQASQLNRSVSRYDDSWERTLSDTQIQRFSILFDVVVSSVHEQGRDITDILCEVLSTQPFPLRKVMECHRLGRFRVTQKANLSDPADGYRSENSQPADWIMIGNHDTAPLWLLLHKWRTSGALPAHAQHLAERLICEPERRAAFASKLSQDAGLLAQAKLAELFASPAQNILIFFADLLGMTEQYNTPGVISADNWTLRVAPDYAQDYQDKLAANAALNLPLALAMAMRARGAEFIRAHQELLTRLEAQSQLGA